MRKAIFLIILILGSTETAKRRRKPRTTTVATTPTPEAPKDTKEPETPPDSTDAPTGDVSGTSEATNEQKESNVGKTDEEIEAIWAMPYDVKIAPGEHIPILRLGNTSYMIYRKRTNWFRAHDHCRLNNLILATFPTVETWSEVKEILFKISVSDPKEEEEFLGSRRYWIGLTDLAGEGEWRWMDTGEMLTYTTAFYAGQPDHIERLRKLTHWTRAPNKTSAHCGIVWNPNFEGGTKHQWDDEICTGGGNSYQYFICQEFQDKVKIY